MHQEPRAEISKEAAEWRVNERRSLSERRFYVDFVANQRWGLLVLVADNLTKAEAATMAESHNHDLR